MKTRLLLFLSIILLTACNQRDEQLDNMIGQMKLANREIEDESQQFYYILKSELEKNPNKVQRYYDNGVAIRNIAKDFRLTANLNSRDQVSDSLLTAYRAAMKQMMKIRIFSDSLPKTLDSLYNITEVESKSSAVFNFNMVEKYLMRELVYSITNSCGGWKMAEIKPVDDNSIAILISRNQNLQLLVDITDVTLNISTSIRPSIVPNRTIGVIKTDSLPNGRYTMKGEVIENHGQYFEGSPFKFSFTKDNEIKSIKEIDFWLEE